MCFCSKGAGELVASIAIQTATIESLTSKVQSETALKSQLVQDVDQHKADREETKKVMEESTTMQERRRASLQRVPET